MENLVLIPELGALISSLGCLKYGQCISNFTHGILGFIITILSDSYDYIRFIKSSRFIDFCLLLLLSSFLKLAYLYRLYLQLVCDKISYQSRGSTCFCHCKWAIIWYITESLLNFYVLVCPKIITTFLWAEMERLVGV